MASLQLGKLEVQEVLTMMRDALKLLDILGELLPPDAPAFHLITTIGDRCAVRLATGGKLWTYVLADDDLEREPSELAGRIVSEHKGRSLVQHLAADHRADQHSIPIAKPQGPKCNMICECGCTDGRHRELKVGIATIVILAIVMFVVVLLTIAGHQPVAPS